MKRWLFSALFLLQTFTATAIEDPYRWLEDSELPQTQAWLAEQHEQSEAYFQKDALRESITDKLIQMTNIESVGVPVKAGNHYLIMRKPKGENQHCIYIMDSLNDTPRMLIDPKTMSRETPLFLTGFRIHPKGTYVAYGLSEGGSDWQEWHVKRIADGEELPDVLTGIKFIFPSWDSNEEGLYYLSFEQNPSDSATSNVQDLYYHRLGDTSLDRKFPHNLEKGLFFSALDVTKDGHYLILALKRDSAGPNGIWYIDLQEEGQKFKELFPIDEASYRLVGRLNNLFYFTTNDHAPMGKVIAVDLAQPENPPVECIPEQNENLEQACFAGNKIVTAYIKDAHSEIKIYDSSGIFQREITLPGMGTTGIVWTDLRIESSTDSPKFYFPYVDFTHPKSIYRCDAETGKIEVISAPKMSWDPQEYIVKQIFYSSKDGTRVPMFIMHKAGLKLDGNNPVVLYGYGGFGISLTPGYSPQRLTWLDLGGIYAIANLRGGGEYGKEWHKAGMLKKKQNVFDDFIAAAEWLCANGYTQPSKLAIEGHSNGGLLVGACLIQRPDLFRAALPGVGVMDMLRFHLFTVGWLWVGEYGSPDIPEDAEYLRGYSPVHQLKRGVAYPATLITTADHDDRVVPLHSYKFAAAMQYAQGGEHPVLLRVYKDSGHGSGTVSQVVQEDADCLYFLMRELGMQKKY